MSKHPRQTYYRFNLYRDRGGKWRWRLFGRNGRKIANGSEGYQRRYDARRGAGLTLSGLLAIRPYLDSR
jgi:uncharacterized protein YegP (UPF0339 family)